MRVVRSSEYTLPRDVSMHTSRQARKFVPVLYGFLRRGIYVARITASRYTVIAWSRRGGADRDYAHYVEYGTRKMRAQPFMRKAYMTMKRTYWPRRANQWVRQIYRAAR